jgi:ubiquinone biosynthesis protein
MWTVAEPVVREWIERHLGAVGRIEDAAQSATGMLASVPSLMTRGAVLVEQLDAITRDGLVLAPETVSAIGASEARRTRWTRIALWTIAVLLAWLIWLLIHP